MPKKCDNCERLFTSGYWQGFGWRCQECREKIADREAEAAEARKYLFNLPSADLLRLYEREQERNKMARRLDAKVARIVDTPKRHNQSKKEI